MQCVLQLWAQQNAQHAAKHTRLLFWGVDRDSRRAYIPPSTETSRQIPGLEFPAKPSRGCIMRMPLVVKPSISPSLYHFVAFSWANISTLSILCHHTMTANTAALISHRTMNGWKWSKGGQVCKCGRASELDSALAHRCASARKDIGMDSTRIPYLLHRFRISYHRQHIGHSWHRSVGIQQSHSTQVIDVLTDRCVNDLCVCHGPRL